MRSLTLTNNAIAPGLLALLALSSSACQAPNLPAPNEAEGWNEKWHGHVSWPIGFHSTSDLDDAGEQFGFGLIDFDLLPPGSPVSLVLQFLGSYADDVPDGSFPDADSTSVTQFNIGARKVWYSGPWQPFIGGGASFVDVSVYDDGYYYYDDDDEDSDSDFGGWAGAGVYYSPGGGFLLGLSLQYSTGAEIELDSGDIDADSFDVMIHFGYGF